MIAYVGLTHRFAPLDRSAEIAAVDLATGRIMRRRRLPAPRFDLTAADRPTGGGRQRGARGVALHNGTVFVATFDTIFALDKNFSIVDAVTNHRFCDLHEFLVTQKGFVATAARMDSVVWCDWQGNVSQVWSAPSDPNVVTAFPEVQSEMPSVEADDWRRLYPRFNPTHLNTVSQLGDRTFVALHNQATLWCIETGRPHHDARCHGAGKTHNHLVDADSAIYMNDTLNGKFYCWRTGNETCIDISDAGKCPDRPKGLSAPWAVDHGWLRGLALISPSQVVVGQCPAKLVILDLCKAQVDRTLPIHQDWRVSVHGIAVENE